MLQGQQQKVTGAFEAHHCDDSQLIEDVLFSYNGRCFRERQYLVTEKEAIDETSMSWWNQQSSAGDGGITPTPNCLSLPFCSTDGQSDFDDSHLSTATTAQSTTANVGRPFVLATPSSMGGNNNNFNGNATSSTSNAMELLSKDMQRLSVAEREKIFYEVNGLASSSSHPLIAEETTEFLERKLDDLDMELDSMLQDHHRRSQLQPNSVAEAYEQALTISPQYVKDRKFRLMFLRSEDYNPNLAARRILRHFREKLKLWGINKLCKTITRDDLNDDDEKSLLSCIITCSGCDRAGRPVVVGLPHRRPDSVTDDNMVRKKYRKKRHRFVVV